MPQLLAPLIVTATSGAIGTAAATTIATAALYVGTTAASMLIQQAMQPTQETGTKLHPASGGDVSQSIIVGEKETAGSFIYGGSWGQPGRTPNAFYVSVYDLQDMPSTAILARCWHADNKGTLDLSRLGYTGSDAEEEGEIMGYPVDSLRDDDGNDYAWVKFLDGSQTVADSYLRTMFGGLADRPWKSTMVGRGRTLMIVTEKFNVDDPTAEKNFTVVVQGMKLYDWRKDSTNGGSGSHRWGDASTYEYSGNNIVIGYNIMRGIFRGSTWLYGGQNWPARRFDNDTWTAAANTCDENITLAGGGTEKRCRMGAEISLAEDPASVLERVFAACGARLVESGGIYKIHVGGIGASVYSFTDDDIFVTEDRSGTLFPSREDICNTITGSYCEPSNGGQMKAYGKRFKQAYIDADGGEVRPKEMTFEYVRENRQAQRLAAHALNDNRRFTTRSIVLPPVARKLEPEDTLNWNSDRYGYSNKKWICGDITLSDSGLVIAAIREADAADADWSPSDEKPYTVGVYGDIVPATQTIDITAVAAGVRNAAGTNKAPGIKISWMIDKDMVDCKAVRWQVRLLDIDDVMDAGRVEFDEGKALIKEGILRNEAYQVRAKIIPYSDRKTGWGGWKTVVADNYGAIGDDDFDNTPPPNIPNNPIWLPTVTNKPQVTSDADRDEDGKVVITVTADWVELANDKIDYQIRLAYGSKVRWVNARSSPREFVGRSGVAYTIRVRPIGRTGAKGNLSDAITFTATKKSTVPDAPTGLTATAKFGRIVLRWSKPTETDFRRANIYVSDDNNFAHATLLDHFTASKGEHGDLGNNVTKFYWVTFENWSGVESLKFPVSDTGGRSASTLRVADGDVDNTALAAPTSLTLGQGNTDTDGDGKIDITLVFTVDDMGSTYKQYEFQLDVASSSGGTFTNDDNKIVSNPKARFKALTTKWYRVRARGLNVGGNPGAWTTTFIVPGPTTVTYATYVGFKPAKKPTFVPAGGVGTPVITIKPKAFYAEWDKPTDPDYAYSQLIRFDTTTGTQIAYQGHADHHLDAEDLVVGRTYVYSIRHYDTSGNPSVIGTVAAGVVYRVVVDSDTDQTAPAVPTGLTISQYAKDVDGDGRVDIGLEAFCDLNTTGVAVKNYEFTIRDPVQSKEWTKFGKVSRNQTLPTIREAPLVAGRTYGFYVRAISFNGTSSGWSARVDFATAKKSAAPSAPTGFSIGSGIKGIRGSWTQPADADIKRYEFYVNTTNSSTSGGSIVKVGNGDTFLDATSRTIGQDYYYFVRSVDRSDNPSAWVAASNNPQKYRVASAVASDNDFDATALAAPSTVGSRSTCVSFAQDNRDINGDGVIDIAFSVSWIAVANAAGYNVEVSSSPTSGGAFTVTGKGGSTGLTVFTFGASNALFYKVRVQAVNAYGQPGAWTTRMYILGNTEDFATYAGYQPAAKTGYTPSVSITPTVTANLDLGVQVSWIDPTEFDYFFTEIAMQPSSFTPADIYIRDISTSNIKNIYWPKPTVFVAIRHVDTSGNRSGWSSVVSATGLTLLSGGNIEEETIEFRHMALDAFALGNAAMPLGSVGSTAFMMKTTINTAGQGAILGSANLVYSDTSLTNGGNPSGGSWMALGRCPQGQATNWLRVT